MITPQHLRNVYISWKSTLAGLFSFAIAIIIAYSTLPAKAGHAVTALAILRVVVDFLKKDAGVTEAFVPGKDGPQAVASTEVPLNPQAVPVDAIKGENHV